MTAADCEQRSQTNAAMRLSETLGKLKAISGTVYSSPNIQSSRSGFEVLSTLISEERVARQELGSAWRVMQAVALVTEMIADVYRELEATDLQADDIAFYSQCLPPIVSALSPQTLYSPWELLSGQLSPVILTQLSHLDRLMRRYVREEMLQDADFDMLIQEIERAYSALDQAAMDKRLRDFVRSQLLKVKRAVDEYRYRGVIGLEEALAGYAGAVGMVHHTIDVSEPTSATTEDKSTVDKLVKVVTVGNALLNLARSVPWVWHVVPRITAETHKLLT